jgi:hypothetical protein
VPVSSPQVGLPKTPEPGRPRCAYHYLIFFIIPVVLCDVPGKEFFEQ